MWYIVFCMRDDLLIREEIKFELSRQMMTTFSLVSFPSKTSLALIERSKPEIGSAAGRAPVAQITASFTKPASDWLMPIADITVLLRTSMLPILPGDKRIGYFVDFDVMSFRALTLWF